MGCLAWIKQTVEHAHTDTKDRHTDRKIEGEGGWKEE